MYRDFSGDPVVRTLLLLQGAQNKITYRFVAFILSTRRKKKSWRVTASLGTVARGEGLR